MSVKIERLNNGFYGELVKNATRYSALAVPIKGYVQCGWLGSTTNGWLIASGMANTKSYLVPNRRVDKWLIQEGFDLTGIDLENFTALVNGIIEGANQCQR